MSYVYFTAEITERRIFNIRKTEEFEGKLIYHFNFKIYFWPKLTKILQVLFGWKLTKQFYNFITAMTITFWNATEYNLSHEFICITSDVFKNTI